MNKLVEWLKKYIIEVQFVIIAIEVIFLILNAKWIESDIEKFVSLLFQFSSIFSAIVLTVIISKVFSQRQENIQRKQEIIDLPNKVSDLRRICKILIDNDNIWPSGLKQKIRHQYKKLDYAALYSDRIIPNSELGKLRTKFVEDTSISENIGSLYLALLSIQGDTKEKNLFLYSNYDYNYTYNLGIINQWVGLNTANSLWYNFDYKYNYVMSSLRVNRAIQSDIERIRSLAKKIDSNKYSNPSEPIEKILSSLGTDFDSFYLVRLRNLLIENLSILPKSVNFSFRVMIAVMVFGVIVPLLIQALKIPNIWFVKADLILFLSIIGLFLAMFRRILINELKI